MEAREDHQGKELWQRTAIFLLKVRFPTILCNASYQCGSANKTVYPLLIPIFARIWVVVHVPKVAIAATVTTVPAVAAVVTVAAVVAVAVIAAKVVVTQVVEVVTQVVLTVCHPHLLQPLTVQL